MEVINKSLAGRGLEDDRRGADVVELRRSSSCARDGRGTEDPNCRLEDARLKGFGTRKEGPDSNAVLRSSRSLGYDW